MNSGTHELKHLGFRLQLLFISELAKSMSTVALVKQCNSLHAWLLLSSMSTGTPAQL